MRPLDHWLNERLVYERKKDSLLPTLTGIVVATLDPLPGGATRSRRHSIPILDPPSVSEMQRPRRRRESDPLPPRRGRRLSGAVTDSGELSKPRRRRESDPPPPNRRRRVSDNVPVQDVEPRRRREPIRRCESVGPLEGPTPPLTESSPSARPQTLAVVLLPTDEERHESTCFAAATEARHGWIFLLFFDAAHIFTSVKRALLRLVHLLPVHSVCNCLCVMGGWPAPELSGRLFQSLSSGTFRDTITGGYGTIQVPTTGTSDLGCQSWTVRRLVD